MVSLASNLLSSFLSNNFSGIFSFIDLPDSNGVSLDEEIVFFNIILNPSPDCTVVQINDIELN